MPKPSPTFLLDPKIARSAATAFLVEATPSGDQRVKRANPLTAKFWEKILRITTDKHFLRIKYREQGKLIPLPAQCGIKINKKPANHTIAGFLHFKGSQNSHSFSSCGRVIR